MPHHREPGSFPTDILNVARSAATVGEAIEQGKEAVNIAVCLLLYSVAVLVFAPRLLHVLTRAGHAPRFGVAVWLVAIGIVLLNG